MSLSRMDQVKAFAESNIGVSGQIQAAQQFQHRGFSDKLISVLIENGIDSPERLLFKDEHEVASIKGVGKSMLAQIRSYRTKFIDTP